MNATRIERRGPIAVVTLDNPPVNGLGVAVRAGLEAAFNELLSDPTVAGVVIAGAGRMFSAGADIREFGTPPPPDVPGLPELIDWLEESSKPVVAAINGVAAGGGLELALGCHVRIAAPKTRLGLPEVTLGILPGAGGTQRLPRIAGVEAALDLIVSGRLVPASEALALGIVDAIAEDGEVVDAAVAKAAELARAGAPPRRSSERDEGLEAARANPRLFDEFRRGMARRARGMNAPYACVRCVEAAVRLPFAEGRRFEREEFKQLVDADEARAMRHVFFAEREAAKIPDVPDSTPSRPIRTAGVIGCGTMGAGIAMTLADAGIAVTVVEPDAAARDAGMVRIRATYQATVDKGRLAPEAVDARMALITAAAGFDAVATADLVIEAVFEEMPVKIEVFRALDAVCAPGAILATNTSTLDVDVIAAATSRPGSVIGTHFFSPANVMRLLEVVRGAKSAPETVAAAMTLSRTLGKVGVLVGVCEGFVGNRMLHPYLREAAFLVEEGAMPQDVDRVIHEFGFPMGPFAMSDLAGNDVGWRIRKGQAAARPSSQRYAGTIADRICERGRFGQKTGAGWYRYEAGDRRPLPDPEVEALILATSSELGITRRTIPDREILERCLYPLVNEGAKILEEGIALRAGDVDVVWVHGYGFPRHRGGPMFWADGVGLGVIADALRRLQAEHGECMAPAPLLERLAAGGKGFKDL